MNVQNKEEARKVMMKYRFNIYNLTLTIFALFLLSISIQASESVENEVTIDSPPEVIMKDFIRVFFSPNREVVNLIRNSINIGHKKKIKYTPNLLKEYFKSNNKIERSEYAQKRFSNLEKRFNKIEEKGYDYVIRKWDKPINVKLPADYVIQKHARKIIKQLNDFPGVNISVVDYEQDKTNVVIAVYSLKEELFSENISYGNEHHILRINKEKYNLVDNCAYHNAGGLGLGCRGVLIVHSSYSPLFNPDILGRDDLRKSYLSSQDESVSEEVEFTRNQDQDVMGYTITNDQHENIYGDCYIWHGHEKMIKESLTTECLLRVLGLYNTSANHGSTLGSKELKIDMDVEELDEGWQRGDPDWKPKVTIKNISDLTNTITPYDELLIRVLYDKNIKAGIPPEQFNKIGLKLIKNSSMEKKND